MDNALNSFESRSVYNIKIVIKMYISFTRSLRFFFQALAFRIRLSSGKVRCHPSPFPFHNLQLIGNLEYSLGGENMQKCTGCVAGKSPDPLNTLGNDFDF